MIQGDAGTWYSASDLLNWLGCRHRSTLDGQAITDRALSDYLRARKSAAVLLHPDGDDGPGFDTPAKARGDEHERDMLGRLESQGLGIVRIDRPDSIAAADIRVRAAETLAAMRAGADVIFQAALLDAPWYGFADFLVRTDDVPSSFGNFAYDVRDTKLARHASASALIQMAHYGAILEKLQGTPPPQLVIWLGTGEEFEWPYPDAAPYLLEARSRFLQFRADEAITVAEPVAACIACRWAERCGAEWGPDDLVHVHRLSRRQRAQFREVEIATIPQLAAADDDGRPNGLAVATFDRLREQARVQTGAEAFRLIRPQPADLGLAGVPDPQAGDLYFDLEGDPFAGVPTLDYLWAYCDTADVYHHRWAHTPDDERAAFAWFMGELQTQDAAGGDWHVYHYNTYELTSMRRLAADWPDEAESATWCAEVERLIAKRFVDLYRVVEAGLRTRDGSTSLKIVEKLAGYDRSKDAAAVAKADDSILAYEQYVMSADEAARAELLRGILEYNTHDVRATHAVHVWLHSLAGQLGADDLLPGAEAYVQSDDVRARILAIADLRDALRQAAVGKAHAATATDRPTLSAEGAQMLAHMLEWHRAESSVQYLDFLRLRAWALDGGDSDEPAPSDDASRVELPVEAQPSPRLAPGTEHESCLLDVQLVKVHEPTTTHKNAARLHDFSCRRGSWKIKVGDTVVAARPDERGVSISLVICDIDPQDGTFSVRRGSVPADVGPLVLKPFSEVPVVWESLMRLGRQALAPDPDRAAHVGFDLLDRVPPLDADAMQPRAGEDAGMRARRIAASMTRGVLPIQGPPGTGKTWLGARLVGDAIARGGAGGHPAVIAVTANSHRVIDNLLVEIAGYCRERGISAGIRHVGRRDQVVDDPRIELLARTGDVAPWLEAECAGGRACVVGATKYAWARPDLAECADVLVIDEAGQVPLADALAVVQAAAVVLALGDPQQLAAPIQAAHEETVSVSLLEHLAQGADVLPPHVGVFLDRSHRMHGALCRVIAHLAYNAELEPTEQAAHRDISGPDVKVAGSLLRVRPGVAWLPIGGGPDAEVTATLAVIDGLVGAARVTLEDDSVVPLALEDILVVAPHNAHVNRIRAARPGIQAGTVDRFQGLQGHVVVYSMGRLAETPGDVPFLYELNRLNVALSRARLLAIVVSQPDATFPPVANPEQLMLASRFIRALEPLPDPAARGTEDDGASR